MTHLALIGVTGRMGRALVRAAADFPALQIVAATASRGSAHLGADIGQLAGVPPRNVSVTADLQAAVALADVVVDFSTAAATETILAVCRAGRKPLLIGTTGLDSRLDPTFDAAARDIALLVAPNTSLGVTLLMELVATAARGLPESFDIEIIEAHHRNKRDAPSGTALALGAAAAGARGLTLDRSAASCQARRTRAAGDIGFAVVRGGDLVGEHTVLFAGTGERLTLSHQATDRTVFARGALQAAVWLAPRPPGRYFMRDLVAYKSGT